MEKRANQQLIQAYDDRRDLAIPGDQSKTLHFCIEHLIETANHYIDENGYFTVALSGGSTPKAIFEGLTKEDNRNRVDWSRVILFWGDERSVPPDNPDSNYHMAMESGFTHLPIPLENIHRMKAEEDLEVSAKAYEELLNEKLGDNTLDLVMLGMGGDGHTASLFPKTHGLHAPGRNVIGNYVPKMETWRMTLTFDYINESKNIVIYVLGESKAEMVEKVFKEPYQPDELPIQKIGTPTHKALWIMDSAASQNL